MDSFKTYYKSIILENFDWGREDVWIIDMGIELRKREELPPLNQITRIFSGEFDYEEFDEMKNILKGLGAEYSEYSIDRLEDYHAMQIATYGEETALKAIEIFENNAELAGRVEIETKYGIGSGRFLNPTHGYVVFASGPYQLNDPEEEED